MRGQAPDHVLQPVVAGHLEERVGQDEGEHRLRDLTRAEHVYQLVHPDMRTDFPPLKSLDAYRNNLPLQLTSFVGAGVQDECGILA